MVQDDGEKLIFTKTTKNNEGKYGIILDFSNMGGGDHLNPKTFVT